MGVVEKQQRVWFIACWSLIRRDFQLRCCLSLLFISGDGTSVGTITLLTPIAVAVSTASGFDLAFCVASVMGGAMFGDNLSFISDTTIAACNGQGCEMKDKFRENFWIAFPAAVVTLILILMLSFQTEIQGHVIQPYHLTQVIACARTDRRHCRYQCICCTADRYCVGCVDYADWWPYRSCRDS